MEWIGSYISEVPIYITWLEDESTLIVYENGELRDDLCMSFDVQNRLQNGESFESICEEIRLYLQDHQ